MSYQNMFVLDYADNEIKVGSRVLYFEDSADVGIVEEITDFDGDVDDDTGRSIMINPTVLVKFPGGKSESYPTCEWEHDYGDYDEDGCPTTVISTGRVEELVVVPWDPS